MRSSERRGGRGTGEQWLDGGGGPGPKPPTDRKPAPPPTYLVPPLGLRWWEGLLQGTHPHPGVGARAKGLKGRKRPFEKGRVWPCSQALPQRGPWLHTELIRHSPLPPWELPQEVQCPPGALLVPSWCPEMKDVARESSALQTNREALSQRTETAKLQGGPVQLVPGAASPQSPSVPPHPLCSWTRPGLPLPLLLFPPLTTLSLPPLVL